MELLMGDFIFITQERLVGAQECDSWSAPDLKVESLYAKIVRHSQGSPLVTGQSWSLT